MVFNLWSVITEARAVIWEGGTVMENSCADAVELRCVTMHFMNAIVKDVAFHDTPFHHNLRIVVL